MATKRSFFDCLITSCIHNSENHEFSQSEMDTGFDSCYFLDAS